MKWRYQTVGMPEGSGITYSLWEVNLDNDGKLVDWATDGEESPSGETAEEMKRDLVHMLLDATRWKPVMVGELSVGMHFERALTNEQNDGLVKSLNEIVPDGV